MLKVTAAELKSYQKRNNLSTKDMCRLLDVTYNTYMNFLNNTKMISLKTINKLNTFYFSNIYKIEDVPERIEIKRKTVKVALENEKDIIEELIEGNEIFETGTAYTYKMIKGVIVRYSSGNPVSINAPILCSNKYEVEKPVPLRIEVGKKYINQNGEIVFIFLADKEARNYKGAVEGHEGFETYNSEGVCECGDSLIEEVSL